MVKYLNCDCINSKCSAIVNQVNLSGNMDFHSGLEFSIRFPEMYRDYLQKFSQNELSMYESYVFQEDHISIINMICYDSYAFPTTLEAIEKSLKYFVKHYKEYHLTEVAFPLLGCDEDGLRMVSVLPIMEKYLKPLPIDCYICFDIEGASNLEMQMLNAFKEMDLDLLASELKLDEIQIASLKSEREHLIRFEDLYHISTIPVECYRKIYQYFYNGEYKKFDLFHQESLF